MNKPKKALKKLPKKSPKRALKGLPKKIEAADLDLIDEIVDRFVTISFVPVTSRTRLTLVLTGCHLAQPLDLARLREATPFEFVHDICGIIQHYKPSTGKLDDHFLPRFRRRTTRTGPVATVSG